MLTFKEKLAIIEAFPELQRNNISMGRVNFHYEESALDKMNVVYHLHPNGNGFLYAEHLEGYDTDHRGMVNIRDYSEPELRSILKQSIYSLSPEANAEIIPDEEHWTNADHHSLSLVYEDGMWNVYAGEMLDGTFPSYNEAIQYLDEEGFERK